MSRRIQNLERLDAIVTQALHSARIPGAALAVVHGNEIVRATGYGLRDVAAKSPMTPNTVYPIASTSKSINATLLGMLVDEGKLAWDAPVQHYLPHFRLQDALVSRCVTLRDLLTMRTGLPRHDVLWRGKSITRAELVARLAHLPLSAGLRERFQYNNLTATAAGHIAEIVAEQSWEELIRARILVPLGMDSSRFDRPAEGDVTCSYHENQRRELVPCHSLRTDAIAPAGGSIHSTVNDMARWIAFNLNDGLSTAGHRLIASHTLREIHSPWMLTAGDPAAPSPQAAYGLGWFVDQYNGRSRLSHTGFLHDVQSCVTLFPEDGLGMVSFVNFSCSRLAPLLNHHAFDLIMGFSSEQTFAQKLAQYESSVENTRKRNESLRRIENTVPSHVLDDYVGSYSHPGYGRIDVRRDDQQLIFQSGELLLALEHWHYDCWAFAASELFEIHYQHPFERANRLVFETNVDGDVAALLIQLEPAVELARFHKEPSAQT